MAQGQGQVIIARNEEDRARATELFPMLPVRYINGSGDWSEFRDASVVLIGEDGASELAPIVKVLKTLPPLPADLTAEDALQWARSHAVTYQPPPPPAPNPLPPVSDSGEEGGDPITPTGSPDEPAGVTLSADDAAYLKKQLERARRLGALRKREQELDAAIAEQEAEHGRLTILDPAPLPDMAIFSGSPEEYDEALAAEEAARSIERSSAWVRPLAGDAWPEPIDLFSGRSARPLNTAWLPSPVGDFVADRAALMGCDPAVMALAALVCCAAAADDDWRVQVKAQDTTWTERPCLWGVAVGDSGTHKSPAQRAMIDALKYLDAMTRDRATEAREAWRLEMEVYEDQRKQYVTERRKNPSAQPPVKPEEPLDEKIMCSDLTTEALRNFLAHNKKCFVYKEELSGLINGLDAYRNGRGGDRELFLELYDGERNKTIERVGAGSVRIKNWSACILGGITPDSLQMINLQEDGLLQRMMVVVSQPGQEGEDRRPDERAHQAYKTMLAELRLTPPLERSVAFSPEAQVIRTAFERQTAVIAQGSALGSGFASHIRKRNGLFGRLALICHLCEAAANQRHPDPEIPSIVAERVANLLGQWQFEHLQDFYGVLGRTAEHREAVWVAGHILARGKEKLTIRELQMRYDRISKLKLPQRRALFAILENSGWLRPALGKLNLERLPTTFDVNPQVHALFAERAAIERAARADKYSARKAGRAAGAAWPAGREPGED